MNDYALNSVHTEGLSSEKFILNFPFYNFKRENPFYLKVLKLVCLKDKEGNIYNQIPN